MFSHIIIYLNLNKRQVSIVEGIAGNNRDFVTVPDTSNNQQLYRSLHDKYIADATREFMY